MSDTENTKGKGRSGPGASWSDHEVLVYVLSAIEFSGVKVDYPNAPTPAGRNIRGCTQKISKVKIAYRTEIEAIKNGKPFEAAVEATPKKAAGGRKRKAANGEDSEETPTKKGGRAKKEKVVESDDEPTVKDEPEGEDAIEEEIADYI
ncbi:hypothetical protein CC86DRAFT_412652 [Ophiobolus disseminans]|uniref:Uncharacterized protein n=1 Tax=Ophiobolus disseminans TaxID=1469910 RepID=A0A6A6ZFF2_9PLEO|nr:hypothetical protein CC86DRAFT_412652 [Ophiobolus disseminans]